MRLGRFLTLLPGLLLVAVGWPLYWAVADPWSDVFFTVLWLGYILVVDALVRLRTGTSALVRGPAEFALLFGWSVLFWWIFEWFNAALRNWSYVEPFRQNEPTHILMFSLAFSTVLPALFETAELIGSWQRRPAAAEPSPAVVPRGGPAGGPPGDRAYALATSALGVVLLVAVLVFPRQLFPLVWICPLLILDPVNHCLGAPSLWARARRHQGGDILALALAGPVCGFFWEFWNSRTAGGHWVYHLPAFLSAVHLFRMPLPGYLGYLPLALSGYAFHQSALRLSRALSAALKS